MEIWRTKYNSPAGFIVSDSNATLKRHNSGAQFELTGVDGVWTVNITRGEVERLIELFDLRGRFDRD
jgi:hypothetical protein